MSHAFASGIISAAVLPFEENGAIDWKTLDRYLPEVAAGGPRGIAMNMDASEGASLSFDEQLEVVKRSKAALRGTGVPLISGVMSTYTGGAVDVAKRLVDAGAEGLAIFAPLPVFIGQLPLSMVVDYHQAIADAVDIPLIAFQFPLSFVTYPPETITAFSKIKKIVAMKEASFDIARTADAVDEAARAPRRIGIMTGSDTFILEAMLLGCDGALIGFAATFTAALVRMQEHAAAGRANEAYELWRRLGPLARFGWSAPLRDYRVRMKQVLVEQGVLPNAVVRGPTPSLSPEDQKTIARLMREQNLYDPEFLPSGGRGETKRRAAG